MNNKVVYCFPPSENYKKLLVCDEKKKGIGDLLCMKKTHLLHKISLNIKKNTHGNELQLTGCKVETLLDFHTQKPLKNRFEFKFMN